MTEGIDNDALGHLQRELEATRRKLGAMTAERNAAVVAITEYENRAYFAERCAADAEYEATRAKELYVTAARRAERFYEAMEALAVRLKAAERAAKERGRA